MDLEQVGGCFPGATVTEVDESGFAGTVKVKLGPIALQYAGTGQFVERDDAAHRAVIEAKGKDKRGNGTAGATVTVAARARRATGTRIDVTTDLVDHRQAGAVRPRASCRTSRDKLLQQFVACIEGQFAEPARSSPAADAGATAPAVAAAASASTASAGSTAPALAAGASASAASAALGSHPAGAATTAAPRPLRSAPPPPADDSIDLGATVLPVLVKSYAPYAVAALAGLVLGWLIGRRRS